MSKATITRFFIGGLLAVLAGAILAVATVRVAIANNVFVMDGPDIVGLSGSPLGVALVGLGIMGSATVIAGFIAGLVSWIGALLNTAQVANKAWFVALLLTGILSVGFIAMIAYILAGPDGTDVRATRERRALAGMANA
jgi:hypothetical protein